MTEKLLRALAVVVLAAGLSIGCGDSATTGSGQSEEGDHGDHDHGDDHGDAGDEFAQNACHGLHDEGTVLEAALDPNGGADVMMTPGDTTWILRLPEGVTSYASIMLPTPHTDWAVFVDHPGVVVSLTNAANDRFDIVPENPNEACPDDVRVDARVHIHEGGPYTVELAAEGAREIRFQMVSEAEGHGDGGDVDPNSRNACAALDGEHVTIAASSTPEAAMAGDVIRPGDSFYEVMLPGGPAYVLVQLPTDHTTWAVFVSEPDVAFNLFNDEAGTFGITPLHPNPGCPAEIQVDTRIHIHAGGTFLLEFTDQGSDHVLFNMASETVGHGDDGDHDDGDHDGAEGEHAQAGHAQGLAWVSASLPVLRSVRSPAACDDLTRCRPASPLGSV